MPAASSPTVRAAWHSEAGSIEDGSRKVNQDSCSLAFSTPNDVYLVLCDGHGEFGHDVSQTVVSSLCGRAPNPTSFDQVALDLKSKIKESRLLYSGCTCVAVRVSLRDGSVTTANAGDSRAVGARLASREAVDLTNDHKPDSPSEFARLKQGSVTRRRGDVARVGGLAVSRAFGDLQLTQLGVTHSPEMLTYKASDFEFIVLASDGVYDVMSSENVVDFVRKGLSESKSLEAIAKELTATCRARWLRETRGEYCDDVTALICTWEDVVDTKRSKL